MTRQITKPFYFFILIAGLASCMSVNDVSVKSYDDAFICDLLGPAWVTLPSERVALSKEVNKRGLICSNGALIGKHENNDKQESVEKGPRSGSGFVINAVGDILTNAHVVDECSSISVHRGTEMSAGVVRARDSANDLAIIETKQPSKEYVKFRMSSKPELAEPIMVFGFPLQGVLSDKLNASSGDITSLAGLNGDSRMLQISAPVQKGNSGGPLVDQYGNVIGVVTSKLNALVVAGVTGDIPQNVNFAIKNNVTSNFLQMNGTKFSTASSISKKRKTKIATRFERLTVLVKCQ